MKKWALIFVIAACSEPVDPPPPPAKTPIAAEPAAPPAQPVSAPVPPPKATVDSGPRIIAMQGAVLVDGQPAVVGSPVTMTSTIETGDNSWVRFTLGPKSIFAVRPNSKFTIGTSERKKISVKLVLGALWSFLPKGSSYEVVTGNAVAGVRGTIIYTGTQADGKSGICACDGEVEETIAGKTKVVKSKHEHYGVFIQGSGKTTKASKPMKSKHPPGHDDKEAMELEKLRETIDR